MENIGDWVSREVGNAIYRHSCPNCGGPNTEARLEQGLPCSRCLPSFKPGLDYESLYRELEAENKLGEFRDIYELEREAHSFIRFFEKVLDSRPWGAQRTWIRRIVRGDSFSIIAPTGVGKTTFGLIAALYFACERGLKSYIIVPTATLVSQLEGRLLSFKDKIGCNARIAALHSKIPRDRRLEVLGAIENGSFDILVSTVAYTRKNADSLSKHRFRLVFVDDVDAVLKSSRSIDAILRILGFTDEDLEAGMRLLKLQREMARELSRVSGLNRSNREAVEEARARIERLREEIERVRRLLEEKKASIGSLIVSSATGRPRGLRVRLFRTLLGFEVGGSSSIGLRRVIDVYDYVDPSFDEIKRRVVELALKLRDGILVFVPMDLGVDKAEELAAALSEAGIKAEAYHSKKPVKILEEFAEGKLNALVGVANYYGTLVRGIDLPLRVKYAIFAGVPRHRFSIEVNDPHPARLMRILSLIAEAPVEGVARDARSHLSRLRRLFRDLSPAALQYISELVAEGRVEDAGSSTRIVAEAFEFVREALRDEGVRRALESHPEVTIIESGGEKYLLLGDAATYVQASGRTSRLYAGGITLGLSITLVDYKGTFQGLMRRAKWMADTEWRIMDEIDLDEIVRRIEEDRLKVSRVLKGKIRQVELVKTALLVVESPNKARTISRMFGQPSVRTLPSGLKVYEVAIGDLILLVAASGGHIYDLAKAIDWERDLPRTLRLSPESYDVFGVLVTHLNGKEEFIPVYTSIKKCLACSYQFVDEARTCPKCGSPNIRDSRDLVNDLRRVAWEVDMVLIGTDPDTEGEKIGWDIAVLIKPYSRAIGRLEFHEVTKKAIIEALKGVRTFKKSLVEAQSIRRIEDRWIGFTLSPLLWCDFWPKYCSGLLRREASRRTPTKEVNACSSKYYYNLSAGRVQTPTLGWIVERSGEAKLRIDAFRILMSGFQLFFRSDEIPEWAANGLKELVKGGREASITLKIELAGERWVSQPPPPPYTTDALITDSNRLLRLGAPETMKLAQDLFEWGLITYHRTDSTRVSDRGIQVAREWIYDNLGEPDSLFKPRSWGEGGAHEAIRPTRPIDAERLSLLVAEGSIEVAGRITRNHLRLYDLVFRRFIASQMREAEVLEATYKITIEPIGFTTEKTLKIRVGRGSGDSDPTKGFTLVAPIRLDDPLPVGVVDAVVRLEKIGKARHYTQGDVIQLMKTKNIGRPSTYAKIIDVLFKRGYIIQVNNNYLIATRRGASVYNYLSRDLASADEGIYGPLARALRLVPKLVSEERTRELEKEMSYVEEGIMSRREVLGKIFREIKPLALPISSYDLDLVRGEWSDIFKECLANAPEIIKNR